MTPGTTADPGAQVPFREAVAVWARVAALSFGGPAGQIAVMHRIIVEEKKWIGEERFLHALNYCMMLPGPEAQQLAIYIGWLLNGVRGGLTAGILFVLPGVLALLGLSAIYVSSGNSEVVTALFAGLGAAVLAIVVQAVARLGGRALGHPALVALAVGAFAALALFGVGFPAVIAVAAVVGWALGRWAPNSVRNRGHAASRDDGPAPLIPDDALHAERPSRRHATRILAIGVVAWGVPVAATLALTGRHSVLSEQSLFFSGAALVTFGGAYAVLAYVAQKAVEVYGWLGPSDMVRGLALAETTPGPLIMVVEFVAFVGAYRDPGTLDPWVAAVIAALLTTWVTFVPCFVFIFLGAPYVERLRGNATISAALTGITAAVVGVIANLAVYFALHTLFSETYAWSWGPVQLTLPEPDSLRPVPLVIACVAAVLIFRLRWSVLRTLAVCAALGVLSALIPLGPT